MKNIFFVLFKFFSFVLSCFICFKKPNCYAKLFFRPGLSASWNERSRRVWHTLPALWTKYYIYQWKILIFCCVLAQRYGLLESFFFIKGQCHENCMSNCWKRKQRKPFYVQTYVRRRLGFKTQTLRTYSSLC